MTILNETYTLIAVTIKEWGRGGESCTKREAVKAMTKAAEKKSGRTTADDIFLIGKAWWKKKSLEAEQPDKRQSR